MSPTVVRTSTGIRVTGVADGVYGPAFVSIELIGGIATNPTGCIASETKIVCEVSDNAAQDPVPFDIEIPVKGSAALSVNVAVDVDDDAEQVRLDTNPSNNTKTVTLEAR